MTERWSMKLDYGETLTISIGIDWFFKYILAVFDTFRGIPERNWGFRNVRLLLFIQCTAIEYKQQPI